MKRAERHRLKQNEVATTVAAARQRLEQHRRNVLLGVVAIVVLAAGITGYAFWQQRTNARASAMLAEAMTVMDAPIVPPAAGETGATPPEAPAGSYPSEQARLEAALPKFTSTYEAHPDSQAGIAARYHAAAILARLGKASEAQPLYRAVVESRDGLYAQMARMGLAEAQARAGQYDEAIAIWKELSEGPPANLPEDGVLMQLGRTYELAGNTNEAVTTYQRVADEFPQSVYAQQAREHVQRLKGPASPAS